MSLSDRIQIAFSDRSDGSMATGQGKPQTTAQLANVEAFLRKNKLPLERSSMQITYGDDRSYTDVIRLDNSSGRQLINSDAVYTTNPNQVIVLPVADCIATVIYDQVTNMLGVLHLGRHSSVAGLIEAFVIEVSDVLGSDPRDWQVWMSPSLQMEHDRLDYFIPSDSDEWREFTRLGKDGVYIDMVGHNRARFIRAGVQAVNIKISKIDTYSDSNYFSHRAYCDGDQTKLGRMLLAARIING